MIKNVEVENYGPIYEKVSLSFEAGRSEKYLDRLIEGTNLQKILFIYGANNSGKSNVLKLFSLLNGIVVEGRNLFKRLHLPNLYKKITTISKIKYTFLLDDRIYEYKLDIDFINNIIKEESLIVDDIYIFQRKLDNVKVGDADLKIENDIFYLTSQYQRQGGNNEIRRLYEYIENIEFIDQQRQNTDEQKNIENLKKNKDEINVSLEKFGFDFKLDVENGSEVEKSEKVVSIKNERSLNLGILESFGTQVFVDLLLRLTNSKSDLIVIDEIERGLHYELVIEFLNYFLKKYPKKQILVATHLTDILEEEVRKDQIYFAEIKDYELTLKRSLNKKYIRETMNFRKIYTSGSIGRKPNIMKDDE